MVEFVISFFLVLVLYFNDLLYAEEDLILFPCKIRDNRNIASWHEKTLIYFAEMDQN